MSDTDNNDNFVPTPPASTEPTATPPAATPTAAPANSTSGMAIAGLICAFFFPLLGLIFSIIGINQTKDNKRGGRGIAIAGLIISILGMLLGLLWIILIFVAAATTDTNDYNYNSSNSDLSSLTSGSESKVTGVVGEAVEVQNVELTVSQVTRNYTPTSEYFTPAAGKEYISVNVALKNNGSESLNFGTYDFSVRDSTGLELSSEYVGEVAGELQSGSLAANGGNTTGVMVFEVAKDDSSLVLIYQPSFYGDVAEITL